jgi:hypothetical protein
MCLGAVVGSALLGGQSIQVTNATFFSVSKVLYTILCACNSLSQAGNVHGPLAL